jgi:hypothetical protein
MVGLRSSQIINHHLEKQSGIAVIYMEETSDSTVLATLKAKTM